MTANQLERFARAHRQVTAADDAAARVRRRLVWRVEEDGSLSGTFRLPPLAGAVLLKALRAACADLEHPYGDVSAETPAPTAPVPGDPADPGRCHVEDGLAISVNTAQMLACTAALSWMRHGRDGILALGRRRRRPSSAIRRAARERDNGQCRFPGCQSHRVDLHHMRIADSGPLLAVRVTTRSGTCWSALRGRTNLTSTPGLVTPGAMSVAWPSLGAWTSS